MTTNFKFKENILKIKILKLRKIETKKPESLIFQSTLMYFDAEVPVSKDATIMVCVSCTLQLLFIKEAYHYHTSFCLY